jgi:conserved oligomeric Golgi complex subunit 5
MPHQRAKVFAPYFCLSISLSYYYFCISLFHHYFIILLNSLSLDIMLNSSSAANEQPKLQQQHAVVSAGSSLDASSSNPASSLTSSSLVVKQLVGGIPNGEEFLREDFDIKLFVMGITKANALLSDQLSKLSVSINSLDKEIREQVSVHHEELLHQAINIESLEEMLEMVQTRISSLKSSSERLRLKITQPYNELTLRILQLSRLQSACDTLRRIKGILLHSGKLRSHMQVGVKEIVKSAQCLNELDFLMRNFDSTGIEIIEQDVHYAHKARRDVEEQAQKIMDKSMQALDQSQMGIALQVFYSLGVLTDKLAELLRANEKSFQKAANELLDVTNLTLLSTGSSSAALSSLHSSANLAALNQTAGTPTLINSMSSGNLTAMAMATGAAATPRFPGGANMPNVGSMSQFRAQLWTNVEKLIDLMYDSCSQLFQLQQILEKKKDVLTSNLYIDEIDFSAIFNCKMYLSVIPPQASAIVSEISVFDNSQLSTSSTVMIYESPCAIIDTSELASKKSVEFLYEQWRLLTAILGSSMLAACNQSNYIKQTFQNEYPKLLKLQNELWCRLLQLNSIIDRYRYVSLPSSTFSSTSATSSSSSANLTTGTGDKLNKQKSSIGVTAAQSVQANLSNLAATQYHSSYDLLRKCFTDLENSYLNRSLSHLFDPINLIFSQGGNEKQINRADIDTYLKGVQTQLQTLQYDTLKSFGLSQQSQLVPAAQTSSSSFTDKVISNICKSIQMYANKSEQVFNSLNVEMQQALSSSSAVTASMSSASTNSSGSGNTALPPAASIIPGHIQAKNLDYVNATHELYEQLNRLLESNVKLNKKLDGKLQTALKSLLAFEENALNPFILSASNCILAIMLTMHQEDFAYPQSQTCSLYIKELQQVLQRMCRDYLQLYNCKQILNPYMQQLAVRCIDLFIRHASLLRPMTDSTRARLLNDSQHIESIVQAHLCGKLTELGITYKQLKAFRHLLQTSSPLNSGGEIVDESHYAPIINESLPYHVLLHYLFSYAPIELKSPHQSLDWHIAHYSDWLDKHINEKERLLVIKSCLEAYVNSVKQRNEKKFANIYPLMIKLLENGLQNAISNQAN